MPSPAITIDEIVIADPPEAWEAAGFTVDDDARCRVGQVRLHLAGRDAGRRIVSWSLRGLDPHTTVQTEGTVDGLPTAVGTAAPAEPAEHRNGVTTIDHIVLVTPDQQRSVAAIEALGLPARRTRQTDTYGAPFLQTFFRAGEVIVELIGPETPSGDGPAGFFGLAFTVRDLDATSTFLGDGIGPSKDAVQPGRRIATMRHKHFGISVAIALMSGGADAIRALEDHDGSVPGSAVTESSGPGADR